MTKRLIAKVIWLIKARKAVPQLVKKIGLADRGVYGPFPGYTHQEYLEQNHVLESKTTCQGIVRGGVDEDLSPFLWCGGCGEKISTRVGKGDG